MNQLFSAGKSFLNKKSDGSGAGGDGGFNPMAMFKSLDKNGDGKITEDVVQQLGLGSAGETAARQVFQQVDANKNGKLDMSEAMAAYEKIKGLMNSGSK